MAKALRGAVEALDGFLGIERFANLRDPQHFVSLSTWRDEAAIARWREFGPHRSAQQKGRTAIFDDYRLRVGDVVGDGGDVCVSEGTDLRGAGELFASVATSAKLLLLGGWASGGEVTRRMNVRVTCDYGMVERSQAPRAV